MVGTLATTLATLGRHGVGAGLVGTGDGVLAKDRGLGEAIGA